MCKIWVSLVILGQQFLRKWFRQIKLLCSVDKTCKRKKTHFLQRAKREILILSKPSTNSSSSSSYLFSYSSIPVLMWWKQASNSEWNWVLPSTFPDCRFVLYIHFNRNSYLRILLIYFITFSNSSSLSITPDSFQPYYGLM
jgi:hypothetical protein